MSVKKIIYIVLGCICVGIGSVGAVLPILPTTPFLLVAAFCFARSSDRLNNWFKSTKLYKKNLENFVKGQGMDVKAKLRIMTTVTIIMAIAVGCMYRVPIGQICVGVVWVLHVIAFTFFIKTPKQIEERNKKREAKRRAMAIARGENPNLVALEAKALDKEDSIEAKDSNLDDQKNYKALDEGEAKVVAQEEASKVEENIDDSKYLNGPILDNEINKNASDLYMHQNK